MRRLACALLLVGAAVPALGGAAPKPQLPGSAIELKASDGWTLRGVHQPAREGEMNLILLHGRGQSKEFWHRLARRLAAEGFGYVALDLRGHGESATGPDGEPAPWRKFKATKTENDWENIRFDIQAAAAFLREQGAEEERVGLIGNEVGGSVALKYAAVNAKVPLLAMLSPGMSYQEVLTVNAMRAYRNRPVLLVYSELDRTAAKATPILYQFAVRSAGERNATLISVPDRPSHQLLNGAMVERLIRWLRDPLQPEDPPADESDDPPSAGGSPDDGGESDQG